MKKVMIALLGIGVAVIAYWLLSPLFITREVNESVEDLFRMAGVQTPEMMMANPQTPPRMRPDQLPAAPAGLDPRTESKGPTMPPPAPMPDVQTVGRGQFTGQAQHHAEGTVSLINIAGEYFIRFEEDFKATNGPDLFVGFGRDGEYTTQLAPLKGNVGSQNYNVPPEIDISQFNEIWVWCRAFSVPFARAILQ